MAFKQPRNVV